MQTEKILIVGILVLVLIISLAVAIFTGRAEMLVFAGTIVVVLKIAYTYWKKVDDFAEELRKRPSVEGVETIGMGNTYKIKYKRQSFYFYYSQRARAPLLSYIIIEINKKAKDKEITVQNSFNALFGKFIHSQEYIATIDIQTEKIVFMFKERTKGTINSTIKKGQFTWLIMELLELCTQVTTNP